MLNHLKSEMNMTFTENGASTYDSTGSDCLDLFATIGAIRRESDNEIIDRFVRAFTEDPEIAMKTLFFARDIRGGLGERRVFRVILHWIAMNESESVRRNLEYVAEYGRFDDLFVLFGTPCENEMLAFVKTQFEKDRYALEHGEAVSLLGKWMPSMNASSSQTIAMAKRFATEFGLSSEEYRKSLSALREKISILENYLRERDYTFDYSKQPSKAMFKYRAAFVRNDEKRYNEFLHQVEAGEKKLHADNVAPYELVEPYIGQLWRTDFMKTISAEEARALNVTWESMPDFGGTQNTLAVIDTSGSMYCKGRPSPASVALSLGIYFADHSKGAYHGHFIEFSERPQLIEIKGNTFMEKLRYVASFHEIANTNLEAVFDVILKTALEKRLPQEKLPSRLVIVSDMEFDRCVSNANETNFRNAKRKYEKCGYKLPEIVFWNVASRNRQQPVQKNEQGVALVSGVTPRLFEMVVAESLSPYQCMMEILGGERYAKIVA